MVNVTMRGGITIQQRACPRCANRLTGRVAKGPSICFNCGHHWHGDSRFEVSSAPLETVPFIFGPEVIARLEVYRLAVRAGFYSEWYSSAA